MHTREFQSNWCFSVLKSALNCSCKRTLHIWVYFLKYTCSKDHCNVCDESYSWLNWQFLSSPQDAVCKPCDCPSLLSGSHTTMHWELLLHARHHPLWLYLCLCTMSSVPMITMAPALMLSRQALNVNETVKCSGPGHTKKHQDINFVLLSRSSMGKWGEFWRFKS